MHVCMYVCVCVCLYVCMHACMYVYVNIYIYVVLYEYIYIYTKQSQFSYEPKLQTMRHHLVKYADRLLGQFHPKYEVPRAVSSPYLRLYPIFGQNHDARGHDHLWIVMDDFLRILQPYLSTGGVWRAKEGPLQLSLLIYNPI